MGDRVSSFLEAARGFRSALASDSDVDSVEFARLLRNAVARVYLAAAGLPRRSSVASEELGAVTRERRHSELLEEGIRRRFGPADTFVDVWDPTDRTESEAIERSLARELAEIDEDLADAISRLEEPQSPDALREVGIAFEQHWGKRAVDVLRPLHRIARGT